MTEEEIKRETLERSTKNQLDVEVKKKIAQSWRELERIAKDRGRWRAVVSDLHPPASTWIKVSK